MKPLIIAEIGQAHEGSLGIDHSYIDALATTGVSAVKWQLHFAEAESSEFEPFRKKFSYEDVTRFDYWKRMEFTVDQWQGLKDHCEEKQMEFIATPFSNYAVDVLESLNVQRYKVGSGDIGNSLLLEKLRQTGKPVILSSGMSDWEELDSSINLFKSNGQSVSLLQCTTSYPTQPENWGLNVIQEMKNRYSIPIGFSDHSGDIFSCLAAVSLGAEIIEFHAIFDQKMFGPDSTSSIDIKSISRLVEGANQISASLQSDRAKSIEEYRELRSMFGKSLCINRQVESGDQITFDLLEGKKPAGKGISAIDYKEVVGLKFKRPMAKWEFLNWKDIEK